MERTKVDEMEEIRRMPEGPGRDAKMMRLAERLERTGEWAQHISAPGKLDLPPLLDENRLKYGIPDSCFAVEAVYDRIFVFQLPRVFGDVIEGTSLIKPESARQREEESTPRGVIVSAGMKALDNLVSNGMGLGHVVNFIRLSPWKLTMQEIAGVEINLLILRDGDIIASEELPKQRQAGNLYTTCERTEQGLEHRLQFNPRVGDVHLKTQSVKPMSPWVPDDY